MNTQTGEEILQMKLPHQSYIVEQILPTGLYLLAGKPKIGKSWFVLQLAISVSNGRDFLGFKTTKSGVLYLSLEDTKHRIQSRLIDYEEYDLDEVEFGLHAKTLNEGLMNDLGKYIHDNQSVRLIIIDTLQKVRDVNSYGTTYGQDYKEINEFNHFVNTTGVSILLVHHLRKMKSEDPFEEISGTTGIAGAVDGMYVLNSDRSTQDDVSFIATGRDIEQFDMRLKFDKEIHQWEVIEKSLEAIVEDEIIHFVITLINEIKEFKSTATRLSELLQEKFDVDVLPNVLSKKIRKHEHLLLKHHIEFYSHRNGQFRTLILVKKSGNHDDDDGSDSESTPT